MHVHASLLVVALASCVAGASGAAELSPECRAIVVALEKSLHTDHSTISTHGKDTVHGVTVQGTTWLQTNDGWRKSPMTVEANIAMSRANLADARSYQCKALPDSVVDGKPVANWSTHTVVADGSADSRIAIAKGSGLVVSVENWHAAPAGPADIVTHYDYANVKRPI
ncbi:MAG: hypothetical protein ACJ8IK_20055 [Burkholderiaceae bacterium]